MPDGRGPQFTPGLGRSGRVSRYRVELPRAGIVPTGEHGHFEATEHAELRTGFGGRFLDLKDRVIGSSMSNARLMGERLSKKVALAVFSSDALSSTAYATQEILLVLVIAGTSALTFSLPIALGITLLLAIVVTSYRQTISAYPTGGGAYIVGHENLGVWAGLTAAAGLMIGYVLTVAVSIAACVEAIVSAAPGVADIAMPLAVALTLLMAFGNLRGLRESGTLFAVPTYGFVAILGATLVIGALKSLFGDDPNLLSVGEPTKQPEAAAQSVTLLLILRAFAAGCSALTGVEAISNGVQAFEKPEPHNARVTMTAMALILGVLFLGTTILARHFGIVFEHGDTDTVMSQIGEEVYGRNWAYYGLQVFTAGILFLAANTAFAGFPLLTAILSRDGYLPRLFHQRGNRLVFTYGIAALTAFSVLLLVVFDANTTRLIPLYAFGVFLSFTIAQSGMVKRWVGLRGAGWGRSAVISGLGALATGVVSVILLITKFADGAWMVVVAIPIITVLLYGVGRFYKALRRALYVNPNAVLDLKPNGIRAHPIIVPVEEINLATVMTLGVACERSRDVTAVHVLVDPDEPSNVEENWDRQFPDIPLVVIDSPFRTVSDPIAVYVNDRLRQAPHEVTVIIPVLDVKEWYARPLVNQSLKRLRTLLEGRRHVEVVPYFYNPGLGAGRRRKRRPAAGRE
ncbi:MAG: APC family permease [Dehalococcoidia bacterium]